MIISYLLGDFSTSRTKSLVNLLSQFPHRGLEMFSSQLVVSFNIRSVDAGEKLLDCLLFDYIHIKVS